MPLRATLRLTTALFGLLACALVAGCSATPAAAGAAPADLVLRNGKIVTMDPAHPQAQAVAITGDRISAVGSSAEIQQYLGPKTRGIDLQGRLAIPGFNE